MKFAWTILFAITCVTGLAQEIRAQTEETRPGLRAAFSSRDFRDFTSTPFLALYVPIGQSPTPFLPAGEFEAVWSGFLSVDLRGTYTFDVEVNGVFRLEINDTIVLDTHGKGDAPKSSIRLNRGLNRLTAMFSSPSEGDAFLRLTWTPRAGFPQPIPASAFSRPAQDAELFEAKKLRRGRQLILEHQCVNCHTVPRFAPELQIDAPSFVGMGDRLNHDWLVQWLLDPKALQSTALMPKMLHGESAAEDAEAIAAYLASLTSEKPGSTAVQPGSLAVAAGKNLFEALSCAACHPPPDSWGVQPGKVSLARVASKFAAGALAGFIGRPDAHYRWTRMPVFDLTSEQSEQLAAYLLAHARPAGEKQPQAGRALVERGRHLVRTSGCLNCHALDVENRFRIFALAEIAPADWSRGCLAGKPGSGAPHFGFSREDREAIAAFGVTDRAALTRHSPVEFAARQIGAVNCMACHGGQFPAFSPLELSGEKLKPEWTEKLLAGLVGEKSRPWLDMQMPAFPAYAKALAEGLAMQHGFPCQTPPEPPLDMEAAEIGRALVAMPPHGFSCVSCHGAGLFRAPAFSDSPGINLARSGERLRYSYFKRWMLNPTLIEPLTKMPVYFEEGRSPLVEYYGGDAAKQIEAFWHYMRLGEEMPPPWGADE